LARLAADLEIEPRPQVVAQLVAISDRLGLSPRARQRLAVEPEPAPTPAPVANAGELSARRLEITRIAGNMPTDSAAGNA
jgi:hypothetical protein